MYFDALRETRFYCPANCRKLSKFYKMRVIYLVSLLYLTQPPQGLFGAWEPAREHQVLAAMLGA